MGLIKKAQIKESGEVFLEKGTIKAPAEPLANERFMDDGERQVHEEKKRDEEQDILSQARAEAEQINGSARGEGHVERRADGRGEIELKIKESLDTINKAIYERKKKIKDS